jgi:hypothetical protein
MFIAIYIAYFNEVFLNNFIKKKPSKIRCRKSEGYLNLMICNLILSDAGVKSKRKKPLETVEISGGFYIESYEQQNYNIMKGE